MCVVDQLYIDALSNIAYTLGLCCINLAPFNLDLWRQPNRRGTRKTTTNISYDCNFDYVSSHSSSVTATSCGGKATKEGPIDENREVMIRGRP